MRKATSLVICGLALCAVFLPLHAPAADSPATKTLEAQGKAIVDEAFTLLSSNLGKALAEGGVSNALAYCSVQALPLTQIVADTNNVRIRRVTLMTRNPANKADGKEAEVLKHFQSRPKGSKTVPMLITNADHSVTFFSPILLSNPLCLNCHGNPRKDIKPEHVEFIRGIYPKDAAVGYKLGDLRGMWRVDFSPAAVKDSR
jgi:hypothetical protein